MDGHSWSLVSHAGPFIQGSESWVTQGNATKAQQRQVAEKWGLSNSALWLAQGW